MAGFSIDIIILLFLFPAFCYGASCMQANGAEGRKNDRLKKEEKERKRESN